MSSGCRVVADLRRTMPPRIGKDSYRPVAVLRDCQLLVRQKNRNCQGSSLWKLWQEKIAQPDRAATNGGTLEARRAGTNTAA
jgi:hypothetical protein